MLRRDFLKTAAATAVLTAALPGITVTVHLMSVPCRLSDASVS